MSIFTEMGCRFLQGSIQVLYSLIHHITCRLEARQALIYQLVSGLTGENGKYNYSKAVHLYPPFFDISCSAKNYKIASALIPRKEKAQLLCRGGMQAGVGFAHPAALSSCGKGFAVRAHQRRNRSPGCERLGIPSHSVQSLV